MTFPGIEIIGLPFVLKIFASWGLLTMLVSGVVTAWQALTSRGRGGGFGWHDPWQQARRNRRAAIVWTYPDVGATVAPEDARATTITEKGDAGRL